MSEKIDYSKGIYDARQLGAGRMFILGVQHMFAMFGATVLVPLLTGLSVSTTLLCAGLGTLLFHLITGGKVPAFLGSSFAYLGGFAIVAGLSTEIYRLAHVWFGHLRGGLAMTTSAPARSLARSAAHRWRRPRPWCRLPCPRCAAVAIPMR